MVAALSAASGNVCVCTIALESIWRFLGAVPAVQGRPGRAPCGGLFRAARGMWPHGKVSMNEQSDAPHDSGS